MGKIFPRNSVNISKATFRAIKESVKNKKVIEGPDIQYFEELFAKYIGSKNAIAVSSARSGLVLILKALDLQPGDEVIFAAYNFHIIPAIVKSCQLKPVFVDVREDTHTINASLIKEKISERTKVIVATHIIGHPCDMSEIMRLAEERNIKVIEDCAHACGAEYKGKKVGSFGVASIFSFGMGKMMNCFGGGIITCNDDNLHSQILQIMAEFTHFSKIEIAKRILKFSIFSILTNPRIFAFTGYLAMRIAGFFNNDVFDRIPGEPVELWKNFPESFYKRFTNLQALVGIEQLKDLDKNIDKIIKNAGIYNRELAGTDSIVMPYVMTEVKHVFLYYRIRTNMRDKLKKALLSHGFDAKRDDIAVCPELNIFSESDKNYPKAKEIATTSLELPCGYYLSEEDIYAIAGKIRKVLSRV